MRNQLFIVLLAQNQHGTVAYATIHHLNLLYTLYINFAASDDLAKLAVDVIKLLRERRSFRRRGRSFSRLRFS